MSGKPTFLNFSRRLLEFMERSMEIGPVPELERVFDRLARELFALQFAHVTVYRQFSEARGSTPERIGHWSEIPAIPTRAFKEYELTSLPADYRTRVFLSSGTTAGEQRSRHFHSHGSLRIYEASLAHWFGRHFLPEQNPSRGYGTRVGPGREARSTQPVFAALTPSGRLASNSSLVHMFETVRAKFEFSAAHWLANAAADGAWNLDIARTREVFERAIAQCVPVLVLGTAFSFVHLLDDCIASHLHFSLTAGSRVMETGGYKGRSRTIERAELRRLICECLGIGVRDLISEYGMSELSSQAYDASGVFRFPPWARAQVVSPETGREVADGEIGLVRVLDLANTFSVMGVQTEDLAIRRGHGFELTGIRAADAEPRGCSLMPG